ncbi:hypothetical protein [Nocardia seriolae]|uniref:Uncharacterized protein n=1 Tax=Nocardia seriolae TaxID=37332 RepID=A0A0B8NA67_9NOCA|nr:hypothetical protein [Nocardia seriolae]APA95783.1 hypothetical protein NS506_01715 [Nocardia seriolae]MTJ66101.1 hypothetical protein [Nocardia seriolae]MTJ74107.1 hypothetical protein [Nocardia seriolae]MTJ85982.1 hypothetical protein [Nocardia seriolae]MTK29976.1 hypothetical protein [Nocardia seriolae]
MTSVAITGHRGLAADTLALVDRALRWEAALRIRPGESELIGVSCLADGPDSLFAQAVLDAGGRLIAVVPARRYRASLPAEHHAVYDRLLAAAARVIELDREHSDPEAHQAGSLRMLDEAAELLAVWDGRPARGYGGTADVVSTARERGMPVTVLWPDGAERP